MRFILTILTIFFCIHLNAQEVFAQEVANTPTPTAPTVSLSANTYSLVLPSDTVLFTGSHIFGVGGTLIANYTFSQVSGPTTGVNISGTGESRTVILPNAGTYGFQLSEKDNDSLTGTSAIVTIVVNAVGTVPTDSLVILPARYDQGTAYYQLHGQTSSRVIHLICPLGPQHALASGGTNMNGTGINISTVDTLNWVYPNGLVPCALDSQGSQTQNFDTSLSANISRSSFFIYKLTGIAKDTAHYQWMLSGLNPAKFYKVVMFGQNTASGDQSMTYWMNGASAALDQTVNGHITPFSGPAATFYLQPDALGRLKFGGAAVGSSQTAVIWCYIKIYIY